MFDADNSRCGFLNDMRDDDERVESSGAQLAKFDIEAAQKIKKMDDIFTWYKLYV